MEEKELQILNKSEKSIIKYVKDFVVDAEYFIDTARFKKILPNTSVKTFYQASISTEDVSDDIYFNIMNIITIVPDKKLDFKHEGSLFEDLSFAMRHFGDGLSGERISEKNETHSFKFTFPSVSYSNKSVDPYITVNIKIKNNYFGYIRLVFVMPFPLSSFYTNTDKDRMLVFNTINDVIIEDVDDHMSNKSPDKTNFEKDTKRFFSILKSWIKQDYPLNEKYEKLL